MAIDITKYNTFLQGKSIDITFDKAYDIFTADKALQYEYCLQYTWLDTSNYNTLTKESSLPKTTKWEILEVEIEDTKRSASIKIPSMPYDYAFRIQIRAYDTYENLYSELLCTDIGFAIYTGKFSADIAPLKISANKTAEAHISVKQMGFINPYAITTVENATQDYSTAILKALGKDDEALTISVNIFKEQESGETICVSTTTQAINNWLVEQKYYEITIELENLTSGTYYAQFSLENYATSNNKPYSPWGDKTSQKTASVKGIFKYPPLQMYRSGIYVNMPEPRNKAELQQAAGAVINSNTNDTSDKRYSVELRDEPQDDNDRNQTPQINFKAKTDNGVLRYEKVNQTNSFTFDRPIVLKDNQGNKFIFSFENGILSMLL